MERTWFALMVILSLIVSCHGLSLRNRLRVLETHVNNEIIGLKTEIHGIKEMIESLNETLGALGEYDGTETEVGIGVGDKENKINLIDGFSEEINEQSHKINILDKTIRSEKAQSRKVIQLIKDLVESNEQSVLEVETVLEAVRDENVVFKVEWNEFKNSVNRRLGNMERKYEKEANANEQKFRHFAEEMHNFVKNYSSMLISKKECPKGWSEVEDVCVYYEMEKESWSNARKRCQEKGGDLFEPNSPVKLGVIGSDDVWVGLHNPQHGKQWAWVESGLASSIPWLFGQPNNYGGEQWCAEVFDGRINDENCEEFNSYICQKTRT